METIDQAAAKAHEFNIGAARASKEEAYPDDIEMLVLYRATGKEKWAMIANAWIGEVKVDSQRMLRSNLKIAREQFGPPLIVIVIADAYMRVFDDKSQADMHDASRIQRGDLTKMHKAKDPRVVEAIIVTTYYRGDDDALHERVTTMPYSNGHDGIDWQEPVGREGEISDGGFAEIVTAAFNEGRN